MSSARKLVIVQDDEGEDFAVERPRTRADCADVPRPCPFVSCRWNLYLDVVKDKNAVPRGFRVQLNFPHLEPHEMTDSCALDIADEGPVTHDVAGSMIGVSKQRCHQIEVAALGSLEAKAEKEGLSSTDEQAPDAWETYHVDTLVQADPIDESEIEDPKSLSELFDDEGGFLDRVYRIYVREIRHGMPWLPKPAEGDDE